MAHFIYEEEDENGLEETIKNNMMTARKMRREIEFAKMTLESNSVKELVRPISLLPNFKEKETVRDFSEYDRYYYMILACPNDENLEEMIYQILNSISNEQLDEVIPYIKASLLKDAKSYEEMACDEDFATECKEVIESLREKIQIIIDFEAFKLGTENTSKNNIVFLRNPSGKVYLDNDKNYLIECSRYFAELFESIENGTFKCVRNLRHYSTGIREIRNMLSCIAFDRLDEDTFIIIGAYLVKNKDKSWRVSLENRLDSYKKQKTKILAQLKEDKENFLSRDRDILETIYSELSNERKRELC